MPSVLIIGLIEPAAFNGDFSKSAFNYKRHGLENLEIQVDNLPIVNHPLKMKGENGNEFFWNYLKNTNRFLNMYSNGSLSYKNYIESNFLIYSNLKNDGHKHGQLTVKMKFKDVLAEKLFCIFVPIYEKKVVFDAYFNAQIQH